MTCLLLGLMWLCDINGPAVATVPAVRGPMIQVTPIDPPPPVAFSAASSAGRCVGAEPLLELHSPGWSVARMSSIMWRESRCQPDAVNSSGATGLLQILSSHCRWLAAELGEPCTRARLKDPELNIRAAAALWLEQGYRAWAQTL